MKIVFVGMDGVPYSGRACDSRLANTANMLGEKASVVILNRYSSLRKKAMEGIRLSENVQRVEILKRRNTSSLLSLVLYALSLLVEPFSIIRLRFKGKIDWLHLYSGHYVDFLIYKIIAFIIGAKVVYEYVEYRSEKPSNGLYHKINNYLCDFQGAKLWDACIAISNYLVDAAKKVNPGLPVIKVTPLGDFDLFDANDKKTDIEGKYVMFCGHAGYIDVVKFVIDSYKASAISNSKQLLLVLGGRQDQITRVKEYYDKCIIKSRIPYDELVALYKHAFALMIPLRNTIEDTARFPNKICEYTAAHGLIVTTNNGEMQYYFKNGDNAVVADECSVDSISSRLDEIEAGKYDLQKIRERSYQTGIDNFSIDTYKESLYNFLKTI